MRLLADFENYKRRAKEEKDNVGSMVKADVVKELLPLLDNFESARTQVGYSVGCAGCGCGCA